MEHIELRSYMQLEEKCDCVYYEPYVIREKNPSLHSHTVFMSSLLTVRTLVTVFKDEGQEEKIS